MIMEQDDAIERATRTLFSLFFTEQMLRREVIAGNMVFKTFYFMQ